MKSLSITIPLPIVKKLITKVPHPRITLPIVGALVLVVVAVLLQAALSCDCKDGHVGAEAYKEQLHRQVTTQDGTPRDGRDPAVQQQNSLASSASKPTGVGQRVDTPAAGVTGSHGHHDHHGAANDPQETGIGPNGCYIDYGIQGEQCLPTHAAMNGQLTCDGVRSDHGGFPNGIKVTGTDRFHLDTNHDGIACNAGD